MTYYVYRTNTDYAYAVGAFSAAGTITPELAAFKDADRAASFARGMAEDTDAVVVLAV